MAHPTGRCRCRRACHCFPPRCKAHNCLSYIHTEMKKRGMHKASKPKITHAIADSNGRFFDRTNLNCRFPWSNYLYEEWICPATCSNSCGRKHIAVCMSDELPTFHKDSLYRRPSIMRIKSKTTFHDLQIDTVFSRFRSRQLPIIWFYGYPVGEGGQLRQAVGNVLADELGFKYVNFDDEIEVWTDLLFRQMPIEELINKSTTVKRLANMCMELVSDEDEDLNLVGTLELIKVFLMSMIDKEFTNGKQPTGFILDQFPCSVIDIRAFETVVYPASLGIYFKPNKPEPRISQESEEKDIEEEEEEEEEEEQEEEKEEEEEEEEEEEYNEDDEDKPKSKRTTKTKEDDHSNSLEDHLQDDDYSAQFRINIPVNFRRDQDVNYTEEEVEEAVDYYGEKSIKILNPDEFGEKEMIQVLNIVKEKLNIGKDGKLPIYITCGKRQCDCFGKQPDRSTEPIIIECQLEEDSVRSRKTSMASSTSEGRRSSQQSHGESKSVSERRSSGRRSSEDKDIASNLREFEDNLSVVLEEDEEEYAAEE